MDYADKKIPEQLYSDLSAYLARVAFGRSRLAPEARELLKKLDPTRFQGKKQS